MPRITFEIPDDQVEQLRTVMDALPINPYGPLMMTVLKALPLGLEPSLKREPEADMWSAIRRGDLTDLNKLLHRNRLPHGPGSL